MVMLNGSRERWEATQHPLTNTVTISLARSVDTTWGCAAPNTMDAVVAFTITKLMFPSAVGAMTGPLVTKEAHGVQRSEGIRYVSPVSSTNRAGALEFPSNTATDTPAKGPTRVTWTTGWDGVWVDVGEGSTEAERVGLPLLHDVVVEGGWIDAFSGPQAPNEARGSCCQAAKAHSAS